MLLSAFTRVIVSEIRCYLAFLTECWIVIERRSDGQMGKHHSKAPDSPDLHLNFAPAGRRCLPYIPLIFILSPAIFGPTEAQE